MYPIEKFHWGMYAVSNIAYFHLLSALKIYIVQEKIFMHFKGCTLTTKEHNYCLKSLVNVFTELNICKFT